MIHFFHLEVLSIFEKNEAQTPQICFHSARNPVKRRLSVFDDVKRGPTQIPLCSVVGHEITTLNACRIGGILSIEIFFSLK